MKKIIIVAVIILLNSFVFADTGEDILSTAVKQNLMIFSVQTNVEQYIYTEEHGNEVYRGYLWGDSAGRFRISYNYPESQVVLGKSEGLIWYFPDQKIVYELGDDLAKQQKPNLRPLADISAEKDQYTILYEGKHFKDGLKRYHQFRVKRNDGNGEMQLWIDQKTFLLTEKIMYDRSGMEILREVYSDYQNCQGLYFPGRVDVIVRGKSGVVKNTTYYRNTILNMNINENIFRMEIPKGAKRKKLLYQ